MDFLKINMIGWEKYIYCVFFGKFMRCLQREKNFLKIYILNLTNCTKENC